MISLPVVCPALANDIKKLQADFVHGYRVGASVFYVSVTDVEGHQLDVTDKERGCWDDHWHRRDWEFEDFLGSDEDLKMLSNKYFFVWDGNHRLLAWNDHINMVHKGDFDWHYCVRSIVLDSKNGIQGDRELTCEV
jgi:hypothetical protein